MKKYGVIHHSDNWIGGPNIESFDTRPEAEKYVKDFIKPGEYHRNDRAIIVENLAEYDSAVIDQTDKTKLYGFKETK